MVAHATSATSEKRFIIAGLVIIDGSNGYGRGKQACRMVTRHCCGRHKVPRRKPKSWNSASVILSRANLNPSVLAKPPRCQRHHSRIIWLAWLACHQACLLRSLMVVDVAHQRCLRRKVEASTVNINNLFWTVAFTMLILCLGEWSTWDSFEDNLEGPRCWPPNGAKHLFLGLRVKTWNGLDLITFRHLPGTRIIRVSTLSQAWWEGDVDLPRREEIRRCMHRWLRLLTFVMSARDRNILHSW
jgi:hypothetical protein